MENSSLFNRFLASVTMNPCIRDAPGGNVDILGGHSIAHSKQKLYMYLCPIPNGFRDRAISLKRSLDLAPNIVLRSRRTAPLRFLFIGLDEE
jgi:hypothetical protein